jgi:3-deoxy-D-manno-octulosonate 8-phosphate phosphatase (KDO 8-P phosphatase)
MKVFNAKDGQGLSLAHTMGIQTGFITGRRSPAVSKRAEELKVTFVYLGQANKTKAFEECMQKAGVTEEQVAYLGDDLPDIPLARRAGLAVSVADGADELKAVCHYTTRHLAGHGAAREVVELILQAQGRWEEAVPLKEGMRRTAKTETAQCKARIEVLLRQLAILRDGGCVFRGQRTRSPSAVTRLD